MPTRIYFPTSGSAALTPTDWEFPTQAASTYTYAGSLTRNATSFAERTGATGNAGVTLRGMIRYVIGPLTAQSISGTVKGQIRCRENNAGANATPGIAIKIVQANGNDRAVLLAPAASDDTSATPPEMLNATSNWHNRRFRDSAENTSIALSTQNASAGDYLVIELGWRSDTGTSRTIGLRIGTNDVDNDLAEEDTTTNTDDYCPWVEFSGALFGIELTTSVTATATAATTLSTTIPLAASVAATATIATTTTTAIPVLSSVSVTADVAAAFTTGIACAASVTASATSTTELTLAAVHPWFLRVARHRRRPHLRM